MLPQIFTSGIDHRPAARWMDRIPPNVVYVRVIVPGHDVPAVRSVLNTHYLNDRYGPTMASTSERDIPAAAVAEYHDKHQHEAAVYVVTRVDRDLDGQRFDTSRFYAYQVIRAGLLRLLGRIRIVGMGRPTEPFPVGRIVPDTDDPDPVPMTKEFEGPPLWVTPVAGVLPWPDDRAGERARAAEQDLLEGLQFVLDELGYTQERIRGARTSGDPRVAWMRQSARLASLSARLAELVRDAEEVETALKPD